MKLLTKNHSRLVGTFFFLSFLGSFFSISAGLTTEQHSALNKVITLAKNLLPSSSITDAIFCDKAYFIDRFFTENNSIVIGNSTYNQDCLAAMRKNSLKNFLEKCKNIKTKTLSASNQDCNFNVELKEWSNCLDFLFRVFIFNNDQRVFVQIQEKIANIIPQVLRIYQLLNNAFPSGQKNIICFPKSQLDKTNLYRQYSNSLFSSETAKKVSLAHVF